MRRLPLTLIVLTIVFTGTLYCQKNITGTVRNTRGDLIIAANIHVVGTSIGTVTDTFGRYNLEVPEEGKAILISYTGYETQWINLGASNIVDVDLRESNVILNEAVVVGYGTQSRRHLTGSIASVDDRAFENVSVQGFEQALQGRMSGVMISGASGALGSQQSIRIRGVGSVTASNQPLYVIDGIILNNDISTINLGGSPGTNPLININPAEIETVDVLKDAASSAIYGVRGSNGVVIITTKKGSFNQEPVVNLDYYTGFSRPTRQYELLNGKQYAELWNRGMTYKNADADQFYDVESQPNTDWFDEVTQSGVVQETNASVTGGSTNTKYFISGTYRDEDGWLKTTNLKRYSFRINFEQQFSSRWTAGMMLNPGRAAIQRQFEDFLAGGQQYGASVFFPNVEARDQNGHPRGGIIRTSIGRSMFAGTPLVNLESQNIKTTFNQVLAIPYIAYKPINKLTLRSEFGTQIILVEDFWKASSVGTGGFDQGRGRMGSQEAINWIWNTTAVFQNKVGQSVYDITLGYFMNLEHYSSFTAAGIIYADDRLETLRSATTISDWDGIQGDATFVGGVGRINYVLANKYLLTASLRIDGSSRFGKNNRYGYFPAVSAGWIISDERFWSDKNIFSFLKLRASWGITGNSSIDNYASLGQTAPRNDYNAIPGLVLDRIGNDDLGWEKNRTLDIGFDFGLFQKLFHGSFLYYNRNTFDLLMDVQIPYTTGINKAFITRNGGEMVNRGIELTLFTDLLKNNFKWSLGGNLSTVYNEVLKMVDYNNDGEDDQIISETQIIKTGETIGSFYLVQFAGVDPSNGDALFYSLEGTANKNYSLSNRIISGSNIPKIYGGITSEMFWAGFDFTFLWQYALDYFLYRGEGEYLQSQMASTFNQTVDQLDAWTPENPQSEIPQARNGVNGNQTSTRYLEKADFLRLKNVQLGYSLRPIGSNKTQVHIYISGQNLLTFTPYKGPDPEARHADDAAALGGTLIFSRPQSRTLVFGINLTL